MEGSDFRKFYQYKKSVLEGIVKSVFCKEKNNNKNSKQFLKAEREPFKKSHTLLLRGINSTWKSNYEVR